MKKYGIIFDCDGTLVDSLGSALDSFDFALQSVGQEFRPPEEIKQYFGMGADKIFLNILKEKEISLRAFEYYLEHQNIKAQKTLLHHGIRELLDTLKSENVPMSIVTGRHSRDLEVLIKPLEMGNYFVTMIADDSVSKSKPEPDGILLAAERMNMDVKDTLYIGDSVGDMHAAQNAGSLSVAALWDGLALESELAATKPSFMARTPADLLKYFRSLK